jgi:hypothetical protein
MYCNILCYWWYKLCLCFSKIKLEWFPGVLILSWFAWHMNMKVNSWVSISQSSLWLLPGLPEFYFQLMGMVFSRMGTRTMGKRIYLKTLKGRDCFGDLDVNIYVSKIFKRIIIRLCTIDPVMGSFEYAIDHWVEFRDQLSYCQFLNNNSIPWN